MNYSHVIIWEARGRQTQFLVSKKAFGELRCLKLKLNYTFLPCFLFSDCKGIRIPSLFAVRFYETQAGVAHIAKKP